MMFFRKKAPVTFDAFRVDQKHYQEDYTAFQDQPLMVIRDLKMIKISMAIFIPVFTVLSFFTFQIAIISGVVCGILSFYIFFKKVSIKPVVSSVVSIIMGIVFGHIFLSQIQGHVQTLLGE